MRRFLLPLILLGLFIAESIFVQLTPPGLFGSGKIAVPRFLIVSLLFLTIYGSKKHGVIYGLLFGLLFDIVYVEIIGIYLFLFPLIAYITTKLMKILQTNVAMASIIVIVGVALLEAGAYQLNFLIHRTDMDFASFLSVRLAPTLILNLIFIILAAFPFKRLFEKYALSLND
ncbi:rod shape-determining protein MreD [Cytobacillus sp. NCCP-133]|uniref:rod shape-determining protein MreD n=1 Tax=Cytobacillus sp. NCCP-133 TaxID=766848 RepID=UPI002231838D|nr:rod shape-determining protein MreD [Cytobacillus sp. NCCP-133]GLB58367.1 rod shape-determining protein MreD [Cytobacillus sp. NCCP-133]